MQSAPATGLFLWREDTGGSDGANRVQGEMDFTGLVEAFLRRVEQRRLQRLAAELWKFAEALDGWLHDLLAHPRSDWRERFESFLAGQEAEGRIPTPESKQSLLGYLTWWATTIGLEPGAEKTADGYPKVFGPLAGLLEEEIRSRSLVTAPPLVPELRPVPDWEPRIVEIKQIKGFWGHYDELVASGKYDPGSLERAFYGLVRTVLPSSEPITRITFDDGTVLILLGGGPDTGALADQATFLLTAGGAAIGKATLKEALVAFFKGLGRETGESVADNVVQEVTGLPVGPASLVPKKGKPPNLRGSSRPPIPRQIKDLRRRSAKELNERQTREGRFPPYRAKVSVREFVTQQELRFVRVYADSSLQRGRWLVRADAIAGMAPEQIRQALGLKYVPKYITDVTVPANRQMRLSVVGPQPQWGVPNRGIEQYELLDDISEANFTNGRPLK